VSAKRPPNRALAIALTLGAAAALVVACFSTRWLASSGGYVGMGLYAMDRPAPDPMKPLIFFDELTRGEMCDASRCTISNGRFIELINELIDRLQKTRIDDPEHAEPFAIPRRPSNAFVPLGYITLIASLIAAVGLIAAAGIAIAKKRPEVPIMPTTIALLGIVIALVTGCVFTAVKPDARGYLGVGWTFFVFGAGIVAGLAGALMINKLIRPIDTEPGPPPSESMAW
jgi:hypothetical protein